MNIIKSVTVLALCLSCGHLSAQETPFKLGVRLGGGMSVTTGLDKILVPEDYYSNYSFKDKWQFTPTVGVFAQYHVDGSIIGVESGFSYWQKASQLVYNDNKELNYKVTPRYNYIGVSALLKIYPCAKASIFQLEGVREPILMVRAYLTRVIKKTVSLQIIILLLSQRRSV